MANTRSKNKLIVQELFFLSVGLDFLKIPFEQLLCVVSVAVERKVGGTW
jgi:hypothetical protein